MTSPYPDEQPDAYKPGSYQQDVPQWEQAQAYHQVVQTKKPLSRAFWFRIICVALYAVNCIFQVLLRNYVAAALWGVGTLIFISLAFKRYKQDR